MEDDSLNISSVLSSTKNDDFESSGSDSSDTEGPDDNEHKSLNINGNSVDSSTNIVEPEKEIRIDDENESKKSTNSSVAQELDRSTLSEAVDFTIANDADEVESIGSIRDEFIDGSEMSVSRASQLLSSADTTRDESILLKVENELNSHPLRLEEEVLEAYGEAEYSDDNENDQDVDETQEDNLNEKQSVVLDSTEVVKVESDKEQQRNKVEENKNDFALDENVVTSINANISENATMNIEKSNESAELIQEETNNPKESEKNIEKDDVIHSEESNIVGEIDYKKSVEDSLEIDKTVPNSANIIDDQAVEEKTLAQDDTEDDEEKDVLNTSKRKIGEFGVSASGDTVSEPADKRPKTVEPELPKTVQLLVSKNTGAKIYLIGTAHFSEASCDDVTRIISQVQPDVVMIELCTQRTNILHLDEATILAESQNLTMQRSLQIMKDQGGMLQGVMYLLLLSMSAHITKELGMAPGGEFRRAFQEAKKVPGCIVHLGDRQIGITLKRALGSLSVWQKMKLFFNIMTSNESITKEDVEKCKERDLLENLLKEMAGEFPALSRVFVDERDLYLAHSLQMAADVLPIGRDMQAPGNNVGCSDPRVVVGVVGIGHTSGIAKHFGSVTPDQIREVVKIEAPSKLMKVTTTAFKLAMLGGLCYGAYKAVALPTRFLITRIRT